MALLDQISDLVTRLVPPKAPKPTNSMSGGIGSGHGMVPFDDDMIVSKPTIVFHASQIFFNFLAMACFASVASFQAKWKVGPSGLTGFAIFSAVVGMFLSAFMLMIPVVYEKYDKFVRLARALKEVRIGFILTGMGATLSLLIAFIVTISAWTQAGCKKAENDPHAESNGKDFVNALPGWCNTKKAGAIFFWLTFIFWGASVVLLVRDWRSGKLHAPRDPPFSIPHGNHDEEEAEEEASYTHIPPARQTSSSSRYDNSNAANSPFADGSRYAVSASGGTSAPTAYTPASTAQPLAGRPSMDAYGAFSDPPPSGFGTSSPGYSTAPSGYSDPAPSGFGASSPGYSTAPSGYSASGYAPSPARSAGPPILPEPDLGPRVSRTMQYADPYAAVRASIAGQQGPASPTSPPSYESYQGYR